MFGHRTRIWLYILAGIFILALAAGVFFYRFIKTFTAASLVESSFVQNETKRLVGEESAPLVSLAPDLLGFARPRTYLFLFLNNTELRPGGGFIGVYAVVRVDKGKTEVLKLQGTERLDSKVDKTKLLDPPTVMRDHLKVKKWYFRDANWSPDFGESARTALDFYRREGGVAGAEIDTVVGVTATVLEEVLRLTGPVTVEGEEFTAETAVETLEYEVEYGYKEDGIHFTQRKDIVRPLLEAVMARLGDNLFGNIKRYAELATRLASERQVMFFSEDAELQKKLLGIGLSPQVRKTTGDYLLWVDANVIGLKSDHAIERKLSYRIYPAESQVRGTMEEKVSKQKGEDSSGTTANFKNYEAEANLTYSHTGQFDWRTGRYRTYARVYVPTGSKFVGVKGNLQWGNADETKPVDQGEELGKQWFGAFAVIQPGETGTLTFRYLLPASVSAQIASGRYGLFVQKQLGLPRMPELTLNFDFDTNMESESKSERNSGSVRIISASPAEPREKWGDARYEWSGSLVSDSEFMVQLQTGP